MCLSGGPVVRCVTCERMCRVNERARERTQQWWPHRVLVAALLVGLVGVLPESTQARQGAAPVGHTTPAYSHPVPSTGVVRAPAVTLPAAGIITTTAGGLTGASGPPTGFGMAPRSVAVDGSGHLLIADSSNDVVWLANLTGITATLFGQSVSPQTMVVVAGDDAPGYTGDGGPATSAELDTPTGVAVDITGNLYIADSGNDAIREVSATGVITTVAGTGQPCADPTTPCGDGGPATQAQLNNPVKVAVDGSGNLYIADRDDQRVREVLAVAGAVTPTSIITTVAGTGQPCADPTTPCGDGGPAAQAQFNTPGGVAVDGSGNLYIADRDDQRVREVVAVGGAITATSIITTVAGTGQPCLGSTQPWGDGGPATAAKLKRPPSVSVDSTGDLFISDFDDQRVREVLAVAGAITATSIITTVAGTGTAGYNGDNILANLAQLSSPGGTAEDNAGNLFISDVVNNRVREVLARGGVITSTCIITSVAGNCSAGYNGVTGPATSAQMIYPSSMIADGSGNLYVADTFNNVVRKVSPDGTITTVAGNGAPGFNSDNILALRAELNSPAALAFDKSGNLYIADLLNNRVREVLAVAGAITPTSIITTVVGTGQPCLDPTASCGDGGPGSQARLSAPSGIAVDGSGDLFIADSLDNRVREVIAGTGVITTVAGTGQQCADPTTPCGDGGPATQAQLFSPARVALDGSGNLYFTDLSDNRVREVMAVGGAITATSVITTVAGTGSAGRSGDGGPATQAQLSSPSGLAVDSSGTHIWIADSGNNRIREVTAGTIFTMAGSGTRGFSGDGGLAYLAQLHAPHDVTLDGAGNIYIADSGNNRVRVVGAGASPAPTDTPTNTPTNTPTPTTTSTPTVPTDTPTATVTGTPPTDTPTVPTATATTASGGPTLTPTNTPTNPPTNTSVPPANTATSTSVPPANTATNTAVPPTNTSAPSGNTPIPPTSVPPTSAPPTNTAVPCPAQHGKHKLSLSAPGKVQTGKTLTAKASFAAHNAPVLLKLQVLSISKVKVTVKVKVKVKGKIKTQTKTQIRTRTKVLYSVQTKGKTSGCGAYQGRLVVKYKLKKAIAAVLTLAVGKGKHPATATAHVTIQPAPKAKPKTKPKKTVTKKKK